MGIPKKRARRGAHFAAPAGHAIRARREKYYRTYHFEQEDNFTQIDVNGGELVVRNFGADGTELPNFGLDGNPLGKLKVKLKLAK